MKATYERDGWNGAAFRKRRTELGRSRAWIAARTGVSEDTITRYELGERNPHHRWRDAAALALKLDRASLGLPKAGGV